MDFVRGGGGTGNLDAALTRYRTFWEGGLALIFPSSTTKTETLKNQAALKLVHHQELFLNAMKLNFPYWQGKRLGIKEIENALCSYSKFKHHSICKKTTGRARKQPNCN
jgi:hypothetical protein